MAAAAASLIPELERVVAQGSTEKRATTLRQITTLFLDGADRLIDDRSPEAGEVMNLLTRRNLLFRIVSAPDPSLDLNIRLGATEYPRSAAPIRVSSLPWYGAS